jgi:hypothetical protein
LIPCRVLGHRLRFWADDEVMRWECERECGAAGKKRYGSAADARRYARALNRTDGAALGRRFSPSLLPLWLGRRAAGASPARGSKERPSPS